MTYATAFRKPVGTDIAATGWHIEEIGFGSVYDASVVPEGARNAGEFIHMAEDWNFGSGDADVGQPVYAVANGTVEYVGSPTGWNGEFVVIRHDLPPGITAPSGASRVYSISAHLANSRVAVGQKVQIGDQIAEIGRPVGMSPHLHFEMRDRWTAGAFDNGYATSINAAGVRGWFDPSAFISSLRADAVDDDFANGNATSAKIEIGVAGKDQVWGVLEARPAGQFDTDWVAVDLVAGTTYKFALRGADTAHQTQGVLTLADPSLRIRDPQGNQIAWDGRLWDEGQKTADDGAGGRDARVSFTAPESGTYHLVAFSATQTTGSYRLSGI